MCRRIFLSVLFFTAVLLLKVDFFDSYALPLKGDIEVMPTLAAVILADGGSLEFVEDNLENGLNRMNKSLYKMAMGELNN